ncbi:MAG: SOS response-associated peptidase family protein [Anaerolineales bacterium]|nr:SOS response-associated peptidase family protein [Anaerolineales bacterium]
MHTCTIITTEPNQLMSTFHNRMPVILDQKDYDQWLDAPRAPHAKHPENLLLLLKPFPADKISAYPVSTLVNKPGNGPSRMCRTSVLIDNS